MKIIIDPGHYGYDSGAVGPAGTYERDVTMAVSQRIAAILQKAGQEVKLTRIPGNKGYINNLSEDLSTRVLTANLWPADLFVSIHCNAFKDPSAHGIEVYTTPGQGPSDQLAETVLEELAAAFPELSLRVDTSDGDKDKEANFYVIRKTDMRAILIEIAFISNPGEEQLLASADGQESFAQAISNGILRYANPENINTGGDTVLDKTGDKPSDWAKEHTEWAKSKQIINGDGQGNYNWQGNVTREAMAAMLHNFAIAYGLEKE